MEVDEEDDADDEEVVVLPGPPGKAAPSPSAVSLNVATAGRKEAPPTKQSAAFRSPPESTKDAGPGKSSQQPSKPQAKPASKQDRHSFKPEIPSDLSKFFNPSEKGYKLLQSTEDWKVDDADPETLENIALHCLRKHLYFTDPTRAESKKTVEVLGAYQLAFFHLWRLTTETSLEVST